MDDASAPPAGTPSRRHRLAGVLSAAAIVGAIVWLLLRDGGGNPGETAGATAPEIASVTDLRSLSASRGQPIYWVGPQPGTKLELTDEADGSVYVRYLGRGDEVGDPRPDFLTVGTYPVADATTAIRRASHKPGARLRRGAGGSLVLVNSQQPTSVYLAYPGSDSQVEVYDPSAARALRLVLSGKVAPAG